MRVTTAPLQPELDRIVAAGAGAVIAELRWDGRTTRLASGVIELGRPRRAPVNGRFRIGGVTEAFTATVVLQLVAEGRLGLDDPLGAHLGNAVPDITVRHLLGHTGGLPENTVAEHTGPGRPRRARELVDLAVLSAPGTRYAHSATGYLLLGMVIEEVTGRPYTREITDRIIKPLKLTATRTPTSSTAINGPHARGYLMTGGRIRDVTRLDPTAAGAAGGMMSSAADLNTFFHALLTGGLLPPAELALMKTPGIGGAHGLGLEIAGSPCGTAYGHRGAILGYTTLSFHSSDGARQLSLSMTPYDDAAHAALQAALTTGFWS
ncbi:serine hydrolase domain-containing protein [Nonomuraea sp. NPDC050540]|uniref:serine hydrolase domain-containing protein n=1 Tax=Nonomuraea sp. NPDC050540 TaxID=3364367 RepID=UPI0037B97094